MTTVGRVVILDETEDVHRRPMTSKILNEAILVLRVNQSTGDFDILKQKGFQGGVHIGKNNFEPKKEVAPFCNQKDPMQRMTCVYPNCTCGK